MRTAKARVLVDDVLVFLEGRFFAELKVFDVSVSKKFTEGSCRRIRTFAWH
jgi:hypothetical protein